MHELVTISHEWKSCQSMEILSSSFKLATHEVHLMVVRQVAGPLVLDANCCLASQHIRGELNTVAADLLFFSGGITRAGVKQHPIAFNNPQNVILTQQFHLYYPEQIPLTFDICQLSNQILSWALSILQTAAFCFIAQQK